MAVAGSLIAASASADVVPGSIGFGWPNSAKDCFQNSNGALFNWCTDTYKKLIIPVPMRSRGGSYCYAWYYANVRMSGNGTDATTCRLFRVDPNNGVYNYGDHSNASNSFGTYAWANGSSTVQLPSGEYTFQVECDVAKKSGSNVAGVLQVAIHETFGACDG